MLFALVVELLGHLMLLLLLPVEMPVEIAADP